MAAAVMAVLAIAMVATAFLSGLFGMAGGMILIGIAFKLLKGMPDPTQQDRIGLLNFETSRMPRDRHTLSITDSFKDEDGDDHGDRHRQEH